MTALSTAPPPIAHNPNSPHWTTHRGKIAVVVLALTGAILVSSLVAIGLGTVTIGPLDTARYLLAGLTGGSINATDVPQYQIIWNIRAPRTLLAVLVGAGLSVVGVAVQSLVRNALADPYILGISSGASVGAVAISLFGALSLLGIFAVSTGAFLGAIGAAVLVYAIANTRTGVSPLRLVLTGVALSFGFQALVAVMIYFAPSYEATSMLLYWMMGSFGAATWATLPLVATCVVAGTLLIRRYSSTLDALALGDDTATSLGINPNRSRTVLFITTALMTGAMVAVSGAIGFVGLVIPHIVRLVVGARHAAVLTLAPLVGGLLMIWVDLLSRTLVAPRELPLGVMTALIGVPVFIMLMHRNEYIFGGK